MSGEPVVGLCGTPRRRIKDGVKKAALGGWDGHFAYAERIKRTEIGPSAEEVLGHFAERMVGLDDKQAVEEAKRCMSCGMCFECDNCVIYCPQTAVKRTPKSEATMGRYVYTDYDLCIGCHICADVCPTGYIKMGLGEH